MIRLKKLWGKIRDAIDRFLEYDPNPPTILDGDGYKIIVHDGLNPEANAMGLAMYSRSPKSFLVHMAQVIKQGWKKFIAQYYVGYGHKSIGDCGSTNICIEGVSMLCAKAIQQYLLYKGQEASTRYLDMMSQEMLNPIGTDIGRDIQAIWRDLYKKLLDILVVSFKTRFPIEEGQKPAVYERAISARAFDVARSLLPAGTTTFVGWHTTLREARDHLLELRHHPLAEVRDVAETISLGLHTKYPSSGFDKRYPETEKYVAGYMSEYTYMEPQDDEGLSHAFDMESLAYFKELLAVRPPKTELPKFLRKFGDIRTTFLLDFGSFRDIQRHRSGVILMPLLTHHHGFHPWYLEQIPEEYRDEFSAVIAEQIRRIQLINCSEEVSQYYIAMGFMVLCEATMGLPSATYIAELRSGQDVHPTLRAVAQRLGRELKYLFPQMALYCDLEPDNKWSTRRGTQTIIEKETK